MGTESEPNIYDRKEPGEQEKKEQTPEEIRVVLEKALEEQSAVDLTILNLEGKPVSTPDLIVEAIEGSYLTMTYLDKDGRLGEEIPLEISRVTKAELRKSSK